jgi:hypothetical protein
MGSTQQHLRTASGHIVDPASEISQAHARRMLFMMTDDDSGNNYTNTVESSSVTDSRVLHRQAPAESNESRQVLQAPGAFIHVDSLSTRLAGSWQLQRVVYILQPVLPLLVAHRSYMLSLSLSSQTVLLLLYCCCSRVCVFRIINLTNPSVVILPPSARSPRLFYVLDNAISSYII